MAEIRARIVQLLRGSRQGSFGFVHVAVVLALLATAVAIAVGTGYKSEVLHLGDGSAWLSGGGQKGQVVHVNGATGTVDAQVDVGTTSFRIVGQGQRVVWVKDSAGKAVAIDTTALESSVTSPALAADKTRLLLSGDDAYIVERSAGRLQRVDQATLRPIGTANRFKGAIDAVADDLGTVWVAVGGEGLLAKIQHGRVTHRSKLGRKGHRLSVTTLDGTPVVLDHTEPALLRPGHGPITLDGLSDRGKLILQKPSDEDARVWLLDTASLQLIGVALDGNLPVAEVPLPRGSSQDLDRPLVNGAFVYVTDIGDGTVLQISTQERKIHQRVPAASPGSPPEVFEKDGYVWVNDPSGKDAHRWDKAGKRRDIKKFADNVAGAQKLKAPTPPKKPQSRPTPTPSQTTRPGPQSAPGTTPVGPGPNGGPVGPSNPTSAPTVPRPPTPTSPQPTTPKPARNVPPVVNDDPVSVPKNSTDFDLGDLLGNDTDANGDALTIAENRDPSHGKLTCGSTTCTYTPDRGYTGPDEFRYKASDGTAKSSNAATVSIQVLTGGAPVPDNPTVTVDEDNPTTFDLVSQATDPDGDAVTVTSFPVSGHGSIVCDPKGPCTYTPEANWNGSEPLGYQLTDDGGLSAQGEMTLTVNPINDAPTLAAGGNPDVRLAYNLGSWDTGDLGLGDVDGETPTIICQGANVNGNGNGCSLGLSAGTSYDFTAYAQDAAGAQSTPISFHITVDPTPPPPMSVTIGKGPAVQTQTCYTTPCRYVTVNIANMTGTVTVECWGSYKGWSAWFTYTTSKSSSNNCIFGYPGEQVYVKVNGVQSNTITW